LAGARRKLDFPELCGCVGYKVKRNGQSEIPKLDFAEKVQRVILKKRLDMKNMGKHVYDAMHEITA
jgi:hypothetical protein